jgi:hypothetical protein
MTRPIFDPADTTSRGRQVQNSVEEKLAVAAVERAKEPLTADEQRLLDIVNGIPLQEVSVKAARLAKIETARLAAIAAAVAQIPADS